MTIGDMARAIKRHCRDTVGDCINCKLNGKGGCYTTSDKKIIENYNLLFGPEAADERGDNNMDKETIIIDLERYDELIKKEAIYDKLTAGSDVNIYVVPRLKEEKTNA